MSDPYRTFQKVVIAITVVFGLVCARGAYCSISTVGEGIQSKTEVKDRQLEAKASGFIAPRFFGGTRTWTELELTDIPDARNTRTLKREVITTERDTPWRATGRIEWNATGTEVHFTCTDPNAKDRASLIDRRWPIPPP